MNIFYIGSSGALSLVPFKYLNASPHAIVAVGINNPIIFHRKIIALENESLALSAAQLDIPVIDLTQPSWLIRQQCALMSIDVILMSCYNRRLPDDVISIAEKGCFNMHPSLLPRYRGPEPIFWQMREGSEIGVSWHKVVHDLDAGDIVAQQKVLLEDGDSYADINLKLANAGANLLPALLADLSAGTLNAVKQDPELVSYHPYPEAHDFVVDASWSAQQAYNFMRATQAFAQPYQYQLGAHRYLLDSALDYDNNDTLTEAVVEADRLYIPCNEGVLIATFTGRI